MPSLRGRGLPHIQPLPWQPLRRMPLTAHGQLPIDVDAHHPTCADLHGNAVSRWRHATKKWFWTYQDNTKATNQLSIKRERDETVHN